MHEKYRRLPVCKRKYGIKSLTSHKFTDTFKKMLLVKFVGENNADELNDNGKEEVGFQGNSFKTSVIG